MLIHTNDVLKGTIAILLLTFWATASNGKPVAPALDALYKAIKPNYTPQQSGNTSPGRDVMICIMPDKFAPTFQEFALWKHKSGTFIKVVKFSDIGASNKTSSCSTSIMPYIKNAYDKWTFKPTYVLLVGDAGVFPVRKFNTTTEESNLTNNATDEYFGEVDSANGYMPDIMVGRICVKDTTEMANLLKKMIQYERAPPTTDTNWFKRGVALSDNETTESGATLQAETVRMASKIQIAAGFAVDTLMCSDSLSMQSDLPIIIQSINKGCSFVNYRGQGWSDGWQAACFSFSNDELRNIKNNGMLPFVTGIGCGIARFNATPDVFSNVTECFAEEWMRLGTAQTPRGAIAVIGPTGNTHSLWNNEIDLGIYTGIFRKGLSTPGQALLAGIDSMFKKNLNKDTTDYLARLFLVIGDPSTHIWKDVPHTATITGPATIPVGTSNQTITVKTGAQPVKNAQVCISGPLNDTVAYATGFTDANGSVTLSITTTAKNDTLSLVARGGNIFPVEKKITIETVGIVYHPNNVSPSVTLTAAYQNLRSSVMTVTFSLPESGVASITIHSLNGALVTTLTSGTQSAGLHAIAWDGRSDNGIPVARGVYLVSLRQASGVVTQPITKW